MPRAHTTDCTCGGHEPERYTMADAAQDMRNLAVACEGLKGRVTKHLRRQQATRDAAAKPHPMIGTSNLVSTDTEAARKGREAAASVNALAAANPLRDFNATARAAWKGQR